MVLGVSSWLEINVATDFPGSCWLRFQPPFEKIWRINVKMEIMKAQNIRGEIFQKNVDQTPPPPTRWASTSYK